MPKNSPVSSNIDSPDSLSLVLIAVLIIQVLSALSLIFLVLLHSGRGGGLSDMFGGGMSSTLGSSGVAERNLNRITIILGLIWITCIILLGLITKFQGA